MILSMVISDANFQMVSKFQLLSLRLNRSPVLTINKTVKNHSLNLHTKHIAFRSIEKYTEKVSNDNGHI